MNEAFTPVFKTIAIEAKKYDPSNPLPLVIMPPNDAARVRRFVASDDTVDRYSEVVIPDGIEARDYSLNPVVMAFHNYERWPLGHAIALGVVSGKFMIDVEFDPPDVNPEAEKVLRKIDLRTVNAGSIGFMPVEWTDKSAMGKETSAKYPTARRIYTKTQLLEFTICPIPANPNALAAALQADLVRRFGAEPVNAGGSEAFYRQVSEKLENINKKIKAL